jgi:2-isopropylmalate synthase
LIEQSLGSYRSPFALERYDVAIEKESSGNQRCHATVQIRLGDEINESSAVGAGPVNALDLALRRALTGAFESLSEIHLTDYKVRVLDGDKATAARVRVLLDTSDGRQSWRTVGMSDNIVDASFQALEDAINYKLLCDGHGGPPQLGMSQPAEEALNVV